MYSEFEIKQICEIGKESTTEMVAANDGNISVN